MKKIVVFLVVACVLCFCGCSRFQQTVAIGTATGTETGLIMAQFVSCSTPQGAVAGLVVGGVAGMVIADKNERIESAKDK